MVARNTAAAGEQLAIVRVLVNLVGPCLAMVTGLRTSGAASTEISCGRVAHGVARLQRRLVLHWIRARRSTAHVGGTMGGVQQHPQ